MWTSSCGDPEGVRSASDFSGRKLRRRGTNVRTELPCRVFRVADLLDLAQRRHDTARATTPRAPAPFSSLPRRPMRPASAPPAAAHAPRRSASIDDVSIDGLLLAGRLRLELGPEADQALPGGQPLGGKASRLLSNRAPFLSQRGHVERRRVDRLRHPGRRALEPVEQLIDAGEFGLRIQQALLFQRRPQSRE